MNNQFTMLLLGPAGSGKSSFISSFSNIDIFPHIAARTLGGANTTKVLTTYEFHQNCNGFSVLECSTKNPQKQDGILSDLRHLASEPDGIEKVFQKINDHTFAQECLSITLSLPSKPHLFPKESKFDRIVIRDSRGFGDINLDESFDMDACGVTDDVNAILFFSISSIQQPTIFKTIIDQVMKTNLKTPMFLLRRDHDLTQNDENFKDKILDNLSSNDIDLKNIAVTMDKTPGTYRLNSLVFELPEVKEWKGALHVNPKEHGEQKQNYEHATKEILAYAIGMYDRLYDLLVQKMKGQYQAAFIQHILDQLLSDSAFKVVTRIVTDPHCSPSSNVASRDTKALAYPVQLHDPQLRTDHPFHNEVSKRGNQYADGVIPSYSYSCVNFRNLFPRIINSLPFNTSHELKTLNPLFHTFMNIVLDEYTITTSTGYTFSNCPQDAFKFYLITDARDRATELLAHHHLTNHLEWKDFSYKPYDIQYEGSRAIAVLMYVCLFNLLNLDQQFNSHIAMQIDQTATAFVEQNKQEDIQKQISRQ